MIRSVLVASCLSAPVVAVPEAWAQRGVDDALLQPLRDLGVVRSEPAEALQRAVVAPYGEAATLPDGALDCERVASEIESLDAVLGRDLDTRMPELSLFAQARAGAGNAVVDAIEDLVELPYRGAIRTITGAERRDREMRDAVQAGMVRRAFLKGVGSRECATPRILVVINPTRDVAISEAVAADMGLSDLDLARRQLAAANAAAYERSSPEQPPAAEQAQVVLASAAAASGSPSDLELARRQLDAANARSAWPDFGEAPPSVAGENSASHVSDLELARRQLAAANAAAAGLRWDASAPAARGQETDLSPEAATTLSDLDLARRQLAAANAAAASGALRGFSSE